MIYIDGTILADELFIESSTGIYDSPKLKQKRVSFTQTAESYFLDNDVNWQFDRNTITLNCYVVGDTYFDAYSKFQSVRTSIIYSGYKQMSIPAMTYKSFIGFFINQEKVRPTGYKSGETTIKFKLQFTEVQPYNVFLKINAFDPLNLGNTFDCSLLAQGAVSAIESSDNTQEITAIANGSQYSEDLTRTAGLSFTKTGLSSLNLNIIGNIDYINTLTITLTGSVGFSSVLNEDVAELMLRNGTLNII